MTHPQPETSQSDELHILINEVINCQKMIDFGGKDWDKYIDKMFESKQAILSKIEQLVRKAQISELEGIEKMQQVNWKFGGNVDLALESYLKIRLEQLRKEKE